MAGRRRAPPPKKGGKRSQRGRQSRPKKPVVRKRGGSEPTFSRTFTSKLGNVFDARDYGHDAWPIGKGS